MAKKELIELEELEKSYFQALKTAIQNNSELIEDRLDFISKNHKSWKGKFKLDNKIQRGAQEVVRAVIFRAFQDWKPFTSPISSDTSFETDDSIINLDIKTIKNIDNDAKQGYLQIRRNQVNYPNKNVKGLPWEPHQPLSIEIEKEKFLPLFSYFVKFIWAKEKDEIVIKEVVICSIPNGKLSEIYGDDFIVNHKTYEYEDKKRTKRISGDTARFNIKKIAQPKLTKDWKRLEEISFKNQTTLK